MLVVSIFTQTKVSSQRRYSFGLKRAPKANVRLNQGPGMRLQRLKILTILAPWIVIREAWRQGNINSFIMSKVFNSCGPQMSKCLNATAQCAGGDRRGQNSMKHFYYNNFKWNKYIKYIFDSLFGPFENNIHRQKNWPKTWGTGFELWFFGIWSDCSTDCATAPSNVVKLPNYFFVNLDIFCTTFARGWK